MDVKQWVPLHFPGQQDPQLIFADNKSPLITQRTRYSIPQLIGIGDP